MTTMTLPFDPEYQHVTSVVTTSIPRLNELFPASASLIHSFADTATFHLKPTTCMPEYTCWVDHPAYITVKTVYRCLSTITIAADIRITWHVCEDWEAYQRHEYVKDHIYFSNEFPTFGPTLSNVFFALRRAAYLIGCLRGRSARGHRGTGHGRL